MDLAYSLHTPAIRPPLVLPSGPAWQKTTRPWLDTATNRAMAMQCDLLRMRETIEQRAARMRNSRHWRILNSIKDCPHILPNVRDLKATWRWLWEGD